MIQMIPSRPNKKRVIDLLKEAIAKSLEEQDHYYKIVTESLKQKNANQSKPFFVQGGGKELLEKMKGCVFPPSDEERREALKLNWDQTLQHLKLSRIKDQDVRVCASHLNRVTEGTQRLRAMALFSDRICPLDADGERLLHFWAKYSSCTVLHQEAVELGLEVEKEVLMAWLSVLPKLMDVFAGEERHTVPEKCQKAIDSIQQQETVFDAP